MLGDYVCSASHLKIVMDTTGKDVHHLKITDLNGTDKMNFGAVLSICHERIETLLDDVPASKGTGIYVRLIRYILEAYTDRSISPSERLYRMWYAVFVLRLWRSWLMQHRDYGAKNFITYNAYMCIELNAHTLINSIVKCRELNEGNKYFLVWLFNSQPCESFFSQSSVANLDILHCSELLHARLSASR